MYKQLSLQELKSINTAFFDHLKSLYTKKQHTFFKWFLRDLFDEGERIYFFDSGRPQFQIIREGVEQFRFIDEVEKIELRASDQEITELHNLFKNTHLMKQMAENRHMIDILIDEYCEGAYKQILDRPYVIYDIETTFTGNDITHQQFEMAYSLATDDDSSKDLPYRYIDRESMRRYCDWLLEYDGRIIWYNHIAFDNPVLVHNVWYGPEELAKLNSKSIDPFLIIKNLIGRRVSLDNVANALISTGKTLTSGKEWEQLLQQYKKTWRSDLLTKVKEYCRNDVKITFGVVLYLLKYQKLYLDGQEYTFTLSQLSQLGSKQRSQQPSHAPKVGGTLDL